MDEGDPAVVLSLPELEAEESLDEALALAPFHASAPQGLPQRTGLADQAPTDRLDDVVCVADYGARQGLELHENPPLRIGLDRSEQRLGITESVAERIGIGRVDAGEPQVERRCVGLEPRHVVTQQAPADAPARAGDRAPRDG